MSFQAHSPARHALESHGYQAREAELLARVASNCASLAKDKHKSARAMWIDYMKLVSKGESGVKRVGSYWSFPSKRVQNVNIQFSILGNIVNLNVGQTGHPPAYRTSQPVLNWLWEVVDEVVAQARARAGAGDLTLLKLAARSLARALKKPHDRALALWQSDELNSAEYTRRLALLVRTSKVAQAWFEMAWFQDGYRWGANVIWANGEWLNPKRESVKPNPTKPVEMRPGAFNDDEWDLAERLVAEYELTPVSFVGAYPFELLSKHAFDWLLFDCIQHLGW